MCKENRVTATQQLSKQLIRVGHSPDPDDAFMFYALAKDKIKTGNFEFTHELVDIETLNRRAFKAELELTALSIHAYAFLHDQYILCTCGASMGDGYGPMVVTKKPQSVEALKSQTIAVPGRLTSAYLALRLCLGTDFTSVEVPFDEIIPAVVAGNYRGNKIDAGLIIHEGQLTYAQSGFNKVIDLGEWWKRETGLPLPLGGNVLRKDIAEPVQRDLLAIMRESIDYGLAHRAEAVAHSMPYARDMDSNLAGKFIGMYVNDYTLDLGPAGREGVRQLMSWGMEAGLLPPGKVDVSFVA